MPTEPRYMEHVRHVARRKSRRVAFSDRYVSTNGGNLAVLKGRLLVWILRMTLPVTA